MKTVTFETKCYEKDWEIIVKHNTLKRKIEDLNYNFSKKSLFINNVNDIDLVKKEADKLVSQNVIDDYYVVEEYADDVLEKLNIAKDSFKGGYYYSISELVSIHLCDTNYLLHFSGDSAIDDKNIEWIDKAIDVLENDSTIIVANPVWNFGYDEAKEIAFKEDNDWYYGYGFSDQCYLINPSNFNKPIYNEYHPSSGRYPSYGGELFEKRVDSYMRNHELGRITNKNISYIHSKY
jgi:hypothetical protein